MSGSFFAGRETETRNSTHGNVISGIHWFSVPVSPVLQTRAAGRRVTLYVPTAVCDQPNTLCSRSVTSAHVLRVGIRVILRLFKLPKIVKVNISAPCSISHEMESRFGDRLP
jgi:hypothetical protein